MTGSNQTPTIPDDSPFPLFERGVVVYRKLPSDLALSRDLPTDTEATAAALCAASTDSDDIPDHLDIEHGCDIRHRGYLDRVLEERDDRWIGPENVHF